MLILLDLGWMMSHVKFVIANLVRCHLHPQPKGSVPQGSNFILYCLAYTYQSWQDNSSWERMSQPLPMIGVGVLGDYRILVAWPLSGCALMSVVIVLAHFSIGISQNMYYIECNCWRIMDNQLHAGCGFNCHIWNSHALSRKLVNHSVCYYFITCAADHNRNSIDCTNVNYLEWLLKVTDIFSIGI